MKVETPQILWNAAEGESTRNPSKKGAPGAVNAALYSVDLLASGLPEQQSHILVTAGNASQVNVWRLMMPNNDTPVTPSTEVVIGSIFQRKPTVLCPITSPNGSGLEYRFSLGREGSGAAINCCKFSPDGLTLAVASDAANVQLYSVPWHKRGGGNGRHHWAQSCRSESDLTLKVVSTGEGITDISWSADGQRLLLASVDHSVSMVQRIATGNDEIWQCVLRTTDHSHYVQGVAYDPLGVYLASMSNDRSVRLYSRKATSKTLKKVLKPVKQQQSQEPDSQQQDNSSSPTKEVTTTEPLQASTKDNTATATLSPTSVTTTTSNTTTSNTTTSSTTTTPQQAVQEWLANTKFEVMKNRVIKYQPRSSEPSDGGAVKQSPRHSWFADEATLESFFRRLAWTADGRYLICPAALHKNETQQPQQQHQQQPPPPHACLIFARHNFEEPHKILSGLNKPAVAIRPNHVRFQLPADHPKENSALTQYRHIFAVLTWDSVILYDTYHTEPLAVLTGLHYANLTDAAWTANGHGLVVVSSDGYLSLIRFAPGELGTPLMTTTVLAVGGEQPCPAVQLATAALTKVHVQDPIPPTEPGPVVLPTSRPIKRAKLTTTMLPHKREPAVTHVLVPKKKKRIQPTPLVTKD